MGGTDMYVLNNGWCGGDIQFIFCKFTALVCGWIGDYSSKSNYELIKNLLTKQTSINIKLFEELFVNTSYFNKRIVNEFKCSIRYRMEVLTLINKPKLKFYYIKKDKSLIKNYYKIFKVFIIIKPYFNKYIFTKINYIL